MSVDTNIKNKNTHVKTFSFEVQPHNVKLLDHLMEQYVLPILRKNTDVNLAQGAIKGRARRRTPEEELEAVLIFGISEKQRITTQRQPIKKVMQGSTAKNTISTRDMENMARILEFGTGKKRGK
jgi:hypothetical protein